jgi:hypothetical protein
MPENGSSRMRIGGRPRTAAANWIFCCIPFDSSSTFLSAQSAISSLSSHPWASFRAAGGLAPVRLPWKVSISRTFIFL